MRSTAGRRSRRPVSTTGPSAAGGPRNAAARRRSIPDPRDAPLDPTYALLPPVPPERLTPQALRARLSARTEWTPEHADDRERGATADPPRPAAVLVPLVARATGVTVLLTLRTAHLTAHAGQIAFPGGRTEPDDGSPIATALRETEEEIGLPRAKVEVIGLLPSYVTGTGFEVTPVVGLVEADHTLTPDPFEVAEAFEVPLAFLMDPANHQRRLYRWADGVERSFVAMPWRTQDGTREHFVWGVTAALLRNLYRLLAR